VTARRATALLRDERKGRDSCGSGFGLARAEARDRPSSWARRVSSAYLKGAMALILGPKSIRNRPAGLVEPSIDEVNRNEAGVAGFLVYLLAARFADLSFDGERGTPDTASAVAPRWDA
jgi:hypothetical protein